MSKEVKFGVDPEDRTQYIDDWEDPEYVLKYKIDHVYAKLGLRAFLIDRDGYYDPGLILEIDWRSRGEDVLKKHLPIIRNSVCENYTNMKESGLFADAIQMYLFIIGLLMGNDVPRAIAVGVAALVARMSMDEICKE